MHSSTQGSVEVVRAGMEISASDEPAVLAGDLNDLSWSEAQEQFRERSGMVDPRLARAFDATFTADNPLMPRPLDYVYFMPDFRLMASDLLHDIGSDHFPLFAQLSLAVPE